MFMFRIEKYEIYLDKIFWREKGSLPDRSVATSCLRYAVWIRSGISSQRYFDLLYLTNAPSSLFRNRMALEELDFLIDFFWRSAHRGEMIVANKMFLE